MPLPAGVNSTTVTIGPFNDITNTVVDNSGTVTIRPDRELRWVATGTLVEQILVPLNFATGTGTMTITLPRTDQVGWVDSTGASVTGWSYIAEWSGFTFERAAKVFQLDSSWGSSTNLALIPDGTGIPASVGTAYVASLTAGGVAGRTGAINLDAVYQQLSSGGGGGGSSAFGTIMAVVPDGKQMLGAIASGSNVYTATSSIFAAGDAGTKSISVQGAGASGAQLVAAITGYTSPTQVTLSVTAGTTVSNAKSAFGTDNGAIVSAAIDAAYNARYNWSNTGMTNKTGSQALICPPGNYFFASQPFPAKQRDDTDPTYGLSIWSPGESVWVWGGPSGTPMTENDAWLGVSWSGFRFLTITPGATWERPRSYPAQTATGGAVTSGSTALTITGGNQFSSTMTSFRVKVPGAGPSGADLYTQATYVSATSATLAVAASTTVSGANVIWNRWLSGVTMENRRERCYWRAWNTLLDPRGTNNNSEFSWDKCQNMNMENTGNGWLYIAPNNPASGVDTSDQFLNYSFHDVKHWSTWAPMINAASGGHIKTSGYIDISDFANGATSQCYVVKLWGQSHARGVQSALLEGFRGENKSANAGFLYSEWADGQVRTVGWDGWSQAGSYTYNDASIFIKTGNTQGAVYTFQNCQMAGKITVQPASNSYQYEQKIKFAGCTWYYNSSFGNLRGPDDVVVFDMSNASSNTFVPDIEFDDDCKGAFRDPSSTGGQAVWGAVVGLHKKTRQLAVQGLGRGSIPSTGTLRYLLPVGAIITRLELILPAGATGETNTGKAWSVTSDPDGAATNIVTATVTGALNAGAWIKQDVTLPVVLTTDAARLIQVSSTAATLITNQGAKLYVHGIW